MYNPASSGGGAFIMKCFNPINVPVMCEPTVQFPRFAPCLTRCVLFRSSTLVDEFAVFNAWHAAVPGPTMVNRAFADSATSDGVADNNVLDIALGYPQRTIFQAWLRVHLWWHCVCVCVCVGVCV